MNSKYIREVSLDPFTWDLKTFFSEMFNYCFPLDFKATQRVRLRKTFQSDKPAKEYVHLLNEFHNMIGPETERNKVIKLSTGLKFEIMAS